MYERDWNRRFARGPACRQRSTSRLNGHIQGLGQVIVVCLFLGVSPDAHCNRSHMETGGSEALPVASFQYIFN